MLHHYYTIHTNRLFIFQMINTFQRMQLANMTFMEMSSPYMTTIKFSLISVHDKGITIFISKIIFCLAVILKIRHVKICETKIAFIISNANEKCLFHFGKSTTNLNSLQNILCNIRSWKTWGKFVKYFFSLLFKLNVW